MVVSSMNIPSFLLRNYRQISLLRSNRKFFHDKILTCDAGIVSEAVIRTHLQQHSVSYKDGYTCLQLENCVCSLPKKNSDFYINKRTGVFLCQKCKATGEWTSYSDLLTKAKTEKVNLNSYKTQWEKFDTDLSDWNAVIDSTALLNKFSDAEYLDIVKEFKLPFYPQVVSEELQIRINNEKDILFFPLYCSGTQVVGYKTYNKQGIESTFPKVKCPGFLRYSKTARTSAVIVAKITDFLALVSSKIHGYDIICLQYGSSCLPPSTLPFFERYSRIILWLGGESMETAAPIAGKLNEKRCFIVSPIQNQVSASQAFLENRNISEILSRAKLTWHKYVTTFSSLREDIIAELQNNFHAAGVPWKRFPALTKILKGHRRGELTVLTGPTGVGKTTFLSEYSLDLAMQGVNTLWGSFEIKNTRLAKIMLTQFAESPISGNIKDYNEICDKFEELPLFFLTLHGQQDIEIVMEAIKHCCYTYDIAHIIIDNVQFMIEVSPDLNQLDRFWKQDYMIQSFRSFASNFNCHVTLVMHPKKTEGIDLSVNSIFGGVKASQEADNILIIQKKDLNTYGVKKYLQVSKNRYSGDLGLFPLHFDKTSLCFSKPFNFTKSLIVQDNEDFSRAEPWKEDEDEDEHHF